MKVTNMKKQPNLFEESLKHHIKQEIVEKERLLSELIEDLENLKIDLSLIKQEYEIKIGRLFLRLDEIDLEILKFKKIGDLINKGIPLEEDSVKN